MNCTVHSKKIVPRWAPQESEKSQPLLQFENWISIIVKKINLPLKRTVKVHDHEPLVKK
jgi:hypothetical protein